jgi:hypothetical protein
MGLAFVIGNASVQRAVVAVFCLSLAIQATLIAIRTVARVRVHCVGIALLVREVECAGARARARVDSRVGTNRL